MKKVTFLCCLFCGLITQAIGATYNCKPQSLGPLAFKSSNEYLFLGDSNYNNKMALVCGHKGTDGCKHGAMVLVHGTFYYKDTLYEAKGVLKCDTSGGSSWDILGSDDFNKCSGQEKMFLGGIGEVDDGLGLYEVRAVMGGKFEDAYYIVFDELCVDEVKEIDTTNASETTSAQDTKQNQPVQNQSGDAGKKSETKPAQDAKQNQSAQTKSGDAGENAEGKWREPCSKEDLLKVPHAKAGRYIYRNEKDGLVCAATECVDGYYLVKNAEGKSQGWCQYGTDPYATKKDSETKPEQGAKQNQSGDAGENAEGKWREPCSKEDLLKVPHAKEGRYIYRTKDKIVCAATACDEGYYLVRNAEGKSQGWCQKGTDPYATKKDSETKPAQGTSSSDASGTGATGADATGAGTYGTGTFTQNQPGGGTSGQAQSTAPVVKQSQCDLGQPGWLVFEGRCIPEKQYQDILAKRQAAKVSALTQKIESAASQLDSMSSRFKVSVWKDAEGKFNTARLASDSIAGVVLGTAGGLITSHVVKKNQVENGFQDIKCTIGGQSVANWGDEFSVGIQ